MVLPVQLPLHVIGARVIADYCFPKPPLKGEVVGSSVRDCSQMTHGPGP